MTTIRDLEYFVTLVDKMNFSKAAKACFVSQPTLSGQIQKLENHLGTPLFERDRKKLIVTPAGTKLVRQAKRILIEMKSFEQQASALKNPLSGELHLGLIPTLGPYLLAISVELITDNLPQMECFYHEYQTEILLEMLDNGELDVLILPYLDSMRPYNCIEIFNEKLLLAAPKSHPLTKQKPLILDSLKGHKVLTLQDGHCLSEQTVNFCFTAGAEEDLRFSASSLETLRFQVAAGSGITLLPELSINKEYKSLISYSRFTNPEPSRMIVAVTRPSFPRMQVIRALAKVLKKAYKQHQKY